MLKYQAPPGTHDVYPGAPKWEENSEKWALVERTFRYLCRIYGYQEIRTPIFEATDLFVRAVGEGTDIVSKEMYTFTDRGDRSMTLRPEGTAPALRGYLEDGLYAEGGVTKLYYVGPIFRYERNQKGRYRQHTQCGIEVLGSQDPALDAEVIQLAMAVYSRLGIARLSLKINSVGCAECRPAYRDALVDFAKPLYEQMSPDNQRRFHDNPLRMLDSKDETDVALMVDAPVLLTYLCADCASHFDSLKNILIETDTMFEVAPRLVRGFDYYTKTAFEVQSPDLGAQSTLCGGGRYDRLVQELGGPSTPGIGFGMGVERALIALQTLDVKVEPSPGLDAFVVTLGDAARASRPKLLSLLRRGGVATDCDYSGKSMKAQMRAANKSHARFALIIGDDELASGTAQVKDLRTSEQAQERIDEIPEQLIRAIGETK